MADSERDVPVVKLKPGRDGRVRGGHLWLFAGDLAEVKEAAGPGDVVEVVDSRGKLLGRGFYNPASQLAIRLLSTHRVKVNREFLAGRIRAAWEYRNRVLRDTGTCRVIYAESDLLPGLIVDKYGSVLVVQTAALGMDRRKKEIAAILEDLLAPTGIMERNDAPSRTLEGLPQEAGVLLGEVPDEIVVESEGLKIPVNVKSGQKTGLFLDQRQNQVAAALLCRGMRVLDLFCHAGGFGLHAAKAGAASVLGVDISAEALEAAKRTAEMNGLAGTTDWREGNVFDLLHDLEPEFDVVILDPPAFARNKASLQGALRGYKELNLRAMKLLHEGGTLVTCSCSHHMTRDLFSAVLADAARDAHCTLRVIEERSQPPDHPVRPGHPETSYLKCFFLDVKH